MTRILIVLALAVAALAVADPRERVGRTLYHAGFPAFASALLDGPGWRGATLYALGRYDEAVEALKDAPFAGASYDLGTALAKAGRLKEAAEALNEALYQDPNDEDARYNLTLVEALLVGPEGEKRDAFNPANASATKQKRGGEAPSDAENEVNSTGDGMAGDRDSGREASTPGGSKVARAGRAQQTKIDAGRGEARGSIGAAEGGGRTGGGAANVAKTFEEQQHLVQRSYQQQAVQASTQWLATLPDDPGQYLKLRLAAERVRRIERGVAAPAGGDQW